MMKKNQSIGGAGSPKRILGLFNLNVLNENENREDNSL